MGTGGHISVFLFGAVLIIKKREKKKTIQTQACDIE